MKRPPLEARDAGDMLVSTALTMRDYFAAAAVTGLAQAASAREEDFDLKETLEVIAQTAYDIADAMLDDRHQTLALDGRTYSLAKLPTQ